MGSPRLRAVLASTGAALAPAPGSTLAGSLFLSGKRPASRGPARRTSRRPRLRRLLIFTLLALAGLTVILVVFATRAAAAAVIWTDGDQNGLWSDPNNWSGQAVPTSADIAVFDPAAPGASDDSVIIGSGVSVAGISILPDYTGTISVAAPLTIGSNGLSQAGGTIGGNAPVTAGSLSLSGGAFAAGSLQVTGPSTIAVPVTTTATQTYSGAVTLASSTTLTGSVISFGSTLDAATPGAADLTLNGDAVFGGMVGGNAPVGNLAVTGTTTVTGGVVRTNGAQSYGAAITTSGGDVDVSSGGAITLGGALDAGTGTVRLSSGAGISQPSGGLTAGALAVTAAGTVDLAAAGNTVGVLAVNDSSPGPVTLSDGAGLVVGAVPGDSYAGGATGITASGNITLTSPAGIALAWPVTTPGTVTFASATTAGTNTTITSSTATFASALDVGTHQLNITGDVAFSSATLFTLSANGASTPGAGYGQLAVASGNVNLGGAALTPAINYAPSAGDTLTLITDPAGTISGTFAGLPDGAALTLNGHVWHVHYGTHAVTLTAGPLPQTVTFTSTPPSPAVYGGSYTPAAAGGGSGNPVTFSIDPSSAGCTLSGGTVSFTGVGACVIDASQAGNTSYLPATAQQSFTITGAPLVITASNGAMTYGGTVPAITPAYTGFVNGDSPGSLTTPPACSTAATSSSPVGTYPSSCSGAADPDYTISYLPGAVTVNQAAQAISFTAPATGVAGTSATLTATGGGSGNPVTFTTDPASGAGVCSVSGDTVSYTAVGSCVIDAGQAGSANYTPAPQVTQTITVTPAAPTLTTTAGGTVVIGSPLTDTATLSGGASPTGTITFTLYDPTHTAVYTDRVTVRGNGTYTTAAGDNPGGFSPTIAGTYQWAVTYGGDSNNTKATATAETQRAVYGFGGFMAPLSKSTLQKSGSSIPVKFRLTNTAGQPISPTVAAVLAAASDVKATLTGPGISTVSALCTWNSLSLFFQCNIKTPTGLVTGTAYQITAQENVTGTFAAAPAVSTATTPNPESIYFK